MTSIPQPADAMGKRKDDGRDGRLSMEAKYHLRQVRAGCVSVMVKW